jgi:hypothetical protein
MIELEPLQVPNNIGHLSDWKGLWDLLPKGHFILDKKITGCGATTYFLENPDLKIILASPRKLLLKDKFKKMISYAHLYREGDINEHDLRQDLDIKEEIESIALGKEKPDEERQDDPNVIQTYNRMLEDYILSCYKKNVKPKILVTYDSLKYVISTLKYYGENLDSYTIVVDEMHSLFQDAKFKAETELNVIEELQGVKNVVYLSATPYLKEYLNQMEEFKNLPYVSIDWPEDKLLKANINKVQTSNFVGEAVKIINSYRAGLFPSKIVDGEIIESKEAVFFLNSVSDICKIIKKAGLKEPEINILCSENPKNAKKLKPFRLTFGSIPEEGGVHKMFTFCTRTSFLGTDFYSTCASTYIFADPTIDSLSIDISMDIPQIIGRQRLESNPFRYDITLFYKTIDVLKDRDAFDNKIEEKKRNTETLIGINSKINLEEKNIFRKKIKADIVLTKYSSDYVGISRETTLKENKLVLLSELRSWEVQQQTFRSSYNILKTLEQKGYTVSSDNTRNDLDKFFDQFNSVRSFETKMELYCKYIEILGKDAIYSCNFIPAKYHSIYKAIGPDKLKALKYEEKPINRILILEGQLGKKVSEELRKILNVGDKLTKADIKNLLKEIYDRIDLKITPKATDLLNYFDVRRIVITNSGKRSEAYEIISMYPTIEIKNNMSVFYRTYNPTDQVVLGIQDIFRIIQTGEGGIKGIITEIRNIEGHEEQNLQKYLNLPLVCWNGVFEKRNCYSIKEYSSYLAIDIDNLSSEDELQRCKEYLISFPFIIAIFRTPSGKGLKSIIQHNSKNSQDHEELFNCVCEALQIPEVDISVKDLARGNYISWDPDIYVNPNPGTFIFYGSSEFIKTPSVPSNITKPEFIMESGNYIDDNRILGCLDSYWEKNYQEDYKEGNRHNAVLRRAIKLCRAGIRHERVLTFLDSRFDISSSEIKNIVDWVYTNLAKDFNKDRNSYGICD